MHSATLVQHAGIFPTCSGKVDCDARRLPHARLQESGTAL